MFGAVGFRGFGCVCVCVCVREEYSSAYTNTTHTRMRFSTSLTTSTHVCADSLNNADENLSFAIRRHCETHFYITIYFDAMLPFFSDDARSLCDSVSYVLVANCFFIFSVCFQLGRLFYGSELRGQRKNDIIGIELRARVYVCACVCERVCAK